MMSDREFYELYIDFDVIVDGMRLKLLEAMKRTPSADFSQPNYTIEKIQRLQLAFHSLWQQIQSVDNESFKAMKERDKLMRMVAKLENENKNLKKDIIL
jgi:hypothetical protein